MGDLASVDNALPDPRRRGREASVPNMHLPGHGDAIETPNLACRGYILAMRKLMYSRNRHCVASNIYRHSLIHSFIHSITYSFINILIHLS